MKIVIASTYVPFQRGGELTLVHSLAAAFRARSYQVDTVLLPFDPTGPNLVEQTLALRSLDLTEASGNTIDRLITLRAPTYALPHPNKVAWLSQLPQDAGPPADLAARTTETPSERARNLSLLTQSEARYLAEARRIYANSKTVANRLKERRNLEVHGVLYPPLPPLEAVPPGDCGDYFLYVSKLHPTKRQELAIEAMKHVDAHFRLLLVGAADDPRYAAELQRMIRLLDLEKRVQLCGWVSEEEKARLLANACAVLYIPFDADSYGYVTLEAFHAGKPVITLTDSAGPTEVIEDSFNGRVVEPEPEALAEAMEQLWRTKVKTTLMGRNAHDTIRLHQISWDRVLEALVA